MWKQAIRAAGLAGAGVSVALAALALTSRMPTSAVRATAAVQAAPTAAASGRVLFDPGPRGPAINKVGPDGSIMPLNPWGLLDANSIGPRVQNLGAAPTRLLVLDNWSPEFESASCTSCAFTRTMCSPVVAPGATWRVSSAVAVVSLSTQPAVDAGAGWAEAATALALGPDATVADVVCNRVAALSEAPGDVECLGAAVLAAFEAGGPSPIVPGADFAAARGEPIGGVILQLGTSPGTPPGGSERWTLDRFEALSLDDIGQASPAADGPRAESFVYDLPGAWIRSPDGLRSYLHLANPNLDCATVVVSAFRTSTGFRGAFTMSMGAGDLETVDLDANAAMQDVNGSAAVRLVSDRPLAAAITVQGTNLSYTVPAIRMPAVAIPVPSLRQLMPLGYQEKVNFAAGEAMSSAWGGYGGAVPLPASAHWAGGDRTANPDVWASAAQDPLDRAQGWETNIPVFNPYPERLDLFNRMQAVGEPRREFGYPLLPRMQTVFQPGFGLGRPGGDGWGEMYAAVPLALPLAIAVHSWREARDLPVQIEGWGVRTWQFDWADWESTAPRFIGLPDLGGPAVASPDDPSAAPIALTGTMTDTFGGRIAIQNPLTQTARIAIDTYAQTCGYAGTVQRTIDARQRIRIDVRDLPGVAHGADAAVVRVLEGAVAAMVELRRPAWFNVAAAPPDVASAYLGTPVDAADAGAVPEPLTARLAVTPTALTIDRAALTPLHVLVGHVPDDMRCAAFTATTDAPWLTITPAAGAFPAVVTLTVDPRRLPIGETTGTLTIVSGDATITGSPQRVTVTVTGEAVHQDPGRAYVPYVVRWADR